MNIIERNFLNILAIGAFGSENTVEPMSQFKWSKLEQLVTSHGLQHYVCAARKRSKQDIPICFDDLDFYQSNTIQKEIDLQQLSNKWLNHRFNNIRRNERHEIDASMPSVELLNIIVANVTHILRIGLSIELVLRLGMFLREKGDRVDFIKIDRWLGKLHLRNLAEAAGCVLIHYFDFSKDEIPFVSRAGNAIATKLMGDALRQNYAISPSDWRIHQTKNGLVFNVPRSSVKSIFHCLSFLSLAPIETISTFNSGIAHGLSEFDE